MDYITVREAARRWKVSERLVQKYCAQGRVDGARKFGASWEIPADTRRPTDLRKVKSEAETSKPKKRPADSSKLMPLMNTPFEPGHCMEYIQEMEDSPQKEIALAEYHYFSGNPEMAVKEAAGYMSSPDTELRLSACLICAYANLSIGEISKAREALGIVSQILTGNNEESSPHLRAAEAFVSAAAAVLLHLPLPEKLQPAKEYMPILPPGLRAFALYVQAHYTYLQGDYSKSLGIVEATLAMEAEAYPIPSIYLHLIAVMDYMSLRNTELAQKHLLEAWNLAKKDDLIEGFGEHHGLLGGMLEAVIKKDWPDDFKRIIAITYRFSAGWRKIHNPETGHDVADNLTTTEFAAAMLAARGWTNQEIGEHMNISPNTVKRHISMALQKLNIKQRQDLKRFMLQ